MALPKLPKLLDIRNLSNLADLADRAFEWTSAAQDLLSALRRDVQTLLDAPPVSSGVTLSYGSPVAEVVGGANADGIATSVARSDHIHALPAYGSSAGTFCQGNDSRLSDARTPTAHASTHNPGGTDALVTAAPGSIQPDDAAAEGTAASFARSDHKHSIVGAAGAQGIGGGLTEGTATSFARSDHDHKLRETGGPTDLTIGSWPDGDPLFRVGSVAQGASIGGNSVSIWMPEAPFASPSSYDDEFAADSGWTKFDATTVGSATNDVTNGFARILQQGQSATKYVGRYKTMSNEDPYTAFWKVDFLVGGPGGAIPSTIAVVLFCGTKASGTWTTTDGAYGVKLFLTGRTFSDSSSSAIAYGIQAIPTLWSNLSTDTASSTGNRVLVHGAGCYVRMRRSSSNFAIEVSNDGIGWYSAGTVGSAASNSKVFGFAYADGTGESDTHRGVLIDLFRVNTSTGNSDTMLGRRRNIAVY